MTHYINHIQIHVLTMKSMHIVTCVVKDYIVQDVKKHWFFYVWLFGKRALLDDQFHKQKKINNYTLPHHGCSAAFARLLSKHIYSTTANLSIMY